MNSETPEYLGARTLANYCVVFLIIGFLGFVIWTLANSSSLSNYFKNSKESSIYQIESFNYDINDKKFGINVKKQDYSTNETENIICDGKTVYIIKRDLFAPINENAAKEYVRFISKYKNNPYEVERFIYDNIFYFNYFYEGDEVVVYGLSSGGYRVRDRRTDKVGYVPGGLLKKR